MMQKNSLQDMTSDLNMLSSLVTSENLQLKSDIAAINTTVLRHGVDIANLQVR